MSRSLVLFLALIPGSAGSMPLAPMEGRVVFRPECFSHPEEEDGRSRSTGSVGGYGAGAKAPASAAPKKQAAAPPPPPVPMASREMAMDELASAPSESARPLDLLVQILSERTGYPAELLEPNLDLEADLGIDSI